MSDNGTRLSSWDNATWRGSAPINTVINLAGKPWTNARRKQRKLAETDAVSGRGTDQTMVHSIQMTTPTGLWKLCGDLMGWRRQLMDWPNGCSIHEHHWFLLEQNTEGWETEVHHKRIRPHRRIIRRRWICEEGAFDIAKVMQNAKESKEWTRWFWTIAITLPAYWEGSMWKSSKIHEWVGRGRKRFQSVMQNQENSWIQCITHRYLQGFLRMSYAQQGMQHMQHGLDSRLWNIRRHINAEGWVCEEGTFHSTGALHRRRVPQWRMSV